MAAVDLYRIWNPRGSPRGRPTEAVNIQGVQVPLLIVTGTSHGLVVLYSHQMRTRYQNGHFHLSVSRIERHIKRMKESLRTRGIQSLER